MDETYLEHFGVKGMKWGVRKEPHRVGNAIRKLHNRDQRRLNFYGGTLGAHHILPIFKSQRDINAKRKALSKEQKRTVNHEMLANVGMGVLAGGATGLGTRIVGSIIGNAVETALELPEGTSGIIATGVGLTGTILGTVGYNRLYLDKQLTKFENRSDVKGTEIEDFINSGQWKLKNNK